MQAGENVIKMLLGNKEDLRESRKVAIEKAQEFAEMNDMFYGEVSAKTSKNIEEVFN